MIKGRPGSRIRDSGRIARPVGSLVLIASADPAVRTWWTRGVSRGFALEEVSDLATLRRLLESRKPSVVLVDLGLPRLSRVKGLPALVRLGRPARFVALAQNPDDGEAVAALKSGAQGYCGRAVERTLIRKMLDAVQKGELWVKRGVMLSLLREVVPSPRRSVPREGPGGVDARLQPLTPREREIAYLVSAGAKNKDIAALLNITETTVKAHLTAIFRKLGIPDRLRLALMISEGDRLDQERAANGSKSSSDD